MSNANVIYTNEETALSNIISSSKNARKTFDDKKLEELGADIKQNGLNQPLMVRKKDNGKFELIAGERRKRALHIIKWDRPVPIRVAPANIDEKRIAIIGLVDNVDRENLTTYEEAAAYAGLVDEHKMSGAEIAREMGRNVSYVNRLLKPYSQLHPTIRNAWQDGNKLCTVDTLGKLVSKFDDGDEQLNAWKNLVEFGQFEKPESEEDEGDGEGGGNGVKEKDTSKFRVRPGLVLERYAILWKGLKTVNENDISTEWVRAAMQFLIGKRTMPPTGIELPEEKKPGKKKAPLKVREKGTV